MDPGTAIEINSASFRPDKAQPQRFHGPHVTDSQATTRSRWNRNSTLDFHFVVANNDGSAGPPRSSPLRRDIRAQVMRDYLRKRNGPWFGDANGSVRTRRLLPASRASAVPAGSRATNGSLSSKDDANSNSLSKPRVLPIRNLKPLPTPMRREIRHDDPKEVVSQILILRSHLGPQRVDQRELPFTPFSLLDSGAFDPFNTVGVVLTPRMQHLLLLNVQVLMPVATCFQDSVDRKEIMRTRINTPGGVYSSIALACLYEHMFTISATALVDWIGNKGYFAEHLPHFLEYKMLMIGAANRMMKEPDSWKSDECILNILHLVFLEGLLPNIPQHQAHMKGLQQMIQLRGGLASLPQFVQNDIRFGHYKTINCFDYVPLFPEPHNPYSYPAAIINRLLSSSNPIPSQCGRSLLELHSKHSMVHQDLHSIWIDMRDFTNFNFWQSELSGPPTLAEERYFRTSYQSIEHRLLALPQSESYTKSTITKFEESCRIASLVYFNQVATAYPPSAPWIRGLIVPLHKALTTYFQLPLTHQNNAVTHTLLWVLFIGSIASPGQVERPWFSRQIGIVSRALALREWKDVREILIQCFYLDNAFGQQMQAVWEEVEGLYQANSLGLEP